MFLTTLLLLFPPLLDSFKFTIDNGAIILTKEMQNEFKLVKFNLPKEIQGDIQKIIDWNKQIKFDKLTEKIRDLEQKGASSNKNYLTLTLYKLLEIGHNTDKIQSALNQWKFLESHTLSSTIDSTLMENLKINNNLKISLTENGQLSAVKIGELIQRMNPFLNDINALLQNAEDQEEMRGLIEDITTTSKILKIELTELGTSVLQLARGKVPPSLDFKLLQTDKYYKSTVKGCNINPYKIICLLQTDKIVSTKSYTDLINVPYNDFTICNKLVKSNDGTIFEIINNEEKYTDCARSIEHMEEEVAYYCKMCDAKDDVIMVNNGKLLITKQIEMEPKISIAAYPALIAFNQDLKINDITYTRTLSPHVEYSDLNDDTKSLFFKSTNTMLQEPFDDNIFYITSPLLVFIILVPIATIMYKIYLKTKNRYKLSGQKRATISALKRANYRKKKDRTNILLKNIAT